MPTLDKMQETVAEWLVEQMLESNPGQSNPWNLVGAVGSGKASILRRVQQRFRNSQRVPIEMKGPLGETDSAAIAPLSTATQLKQHDMLNGELEVIRNPQRPLQEKLAIKDKPSRSWPTLLEKQQAELLTFDEKLRHYADQRISLNLDDGVRVTDVSQIHSDKE